MSLQGFPAERVGPTVRAMRYLLSAAALLLLVACEPTTSTDAGAAPGDSRQREARASSCGANTVQNFVGGPRSALSQTTFPRGTRFIFPGMPVTTEFLPERLNFTIGPDGIVSKAWCG